MSNWVRTEGFDSPLFIVIFGWERVMEKVREGAGYSPAVG